MSNNHEPTTSTKAEDQTFDIKASSNAELTLASPILVDSSDPSFDFYGFESGSDYGSDCSVDYHYGVSNLNGGTRYFNDSDSENEFFRRLDKKIDEVLVLVQTWKINDYGNGYKRRKSESELKRKHLEKCSHRRKTQWKEGH